MISILIPVYNTKKDFLKQSVISCLKQSFQNFEIVLIDNQSDNKETLELLEKMKNNQKIKIYNCDRQNGKKNLSVALNFGIQMCNYDLIARMDSDDIMSQDRLQKQFDYMVANKDVSILGGQLETIHNNSKTSHPKIISKEYALKNDWFINHPTVMFRKNKILQLGGYKETPEFFPEDYDLWLRALSNGLSIHNINDIVLYYRVHENNLTSYTQSKSEYFVNLLNIKKEFASKNDII